MTRSPIVSESGAHAVVTVTSVPPSLNRLVISPRHRSSVLLRTLNVLRNKCRPIGFHPFERDLAEGMVVRILPQPISGRALVVGNRECRPSGIMKSGLRPRACSCSDSAANATPSVTAFPPAFPGDGSSRQRLQPGISAVRRSPPLPTQRRIDIQSCETRIMPCTHASGRCAKSARRPRCRKARRR